MTLRRTVLVTVIGALIGVPTAQAQSAISLVGGPGDTTVPVRLIGGLTVTFHGDPAAGCARRGLCAYSGVVVFRPGSTGSIDISTRRHGGRVTRNAFIYAENGSTWEHVDRIGASGPVGKCGDVAPYPTPGLPRDFRRQVVLALLLPGGNLLTTRCAGPIDGDVAAAGPRVAVPFGMLRPGRRISLASSHPFAVAGLAGTVTSTIVVHVVKPQKGPPGGPIPRPPKRRIRVVVEHLKVVDAAGRLAVHIAGVGETRLCSPLDSCGLTGALTVSIRPQGASGDLTVIGPARRPVADFLAALGQRSGGSARGLIVVGEIHWSNGGTYRVALDQGGRCTDSGRLGGGTVDLTPTGGRVMSDYRLDSFLRTRCPGPVFSLSRSAGHGVLPARELGRPRFTLHIPAAAVWLDDGYRARVTGGLTLRIRRGRITRHVFRTFY